ncbi:MAG: RyR domain-containing protein, partial [Mycobacterium sp.]
MSADPATNMFWLEAITRRLAPVGTKQRLPLIVRIDDPWQSEAWRAQPVGGSATHWAADAVGKYEITARWLLDHIIATTTVQRVFVCGTSPLTLALCASLTRRQLERDYYSAPDEIPLPALTLVSEGAEEYHQDHEFHRRQLGFLSSGPIIDATPQAPTVPTLAGLIDGDAESTAVIFVDDVAHGPSGGKSTGTRLAARFPTMPVYSWDPDARMASAPLSIVGRLRTFRLALDIPEGQAQDAWERAAMLIHSRFVATIGPQSSPSPARMPWAQLDVFYRGSNRRQLHNALWMVEQIAGHTWNTWGSPPAPLTAQDMAGLQPLEQLARMGYDRDSALKMAQAEHEDWCRYYRRNGWKYGTVRDDARRIHNKLVDWSVMQADPD